MQKTHVGIFLVVMILLAGCNNNRTKQASASKEPVVANPVRIAATEPVTEANLLQKVVKAGTDNMGGSPADVLNAMGSQPSKVEERVRDIIWQYKEDWQGDRPF